MLNKKEFKKIYFNCLKWVANYINSNLIKVFARNNPGYGRNGFNLIKYYQIEWEEYYQAYKVVYKTIGKKGKICDCGGFLGIFALVMSEIGYKVSIVEAMKYYDDVLDGLYEFMRQKGIDIIDFDMFETEEGFESREYSFDMVCSMAVIEHYPYSLKHYIDNMKILGKKGYLYITAPNIAVMHKRILFLHGFTPLSDITEIYNSSIPYTGHCHEMTMVEMEKIAELSDCKVIGKYYNTSYYYSRGWRKVLYFICHKLFPEVRENLGILLKECSW